MPGNGSKLYLKDIMPMQCNGKVKGNVKGKNEHHLKAGSFETWL